jgi:hypothetical protein
MIISLINYCPFKATATTTSSGTFTAGETTYINVSLVSFLGLTSITANLAVLLHAPS